MKEDMKEEDMLDIEHRSDPSLWMSSFFFVTGLDGFCGQMFLCTKIN